MSWDSPQSVLRVHFSYSSKGSASWQVMPQRSVLLFLQTQALLHPGQELVDLILPHALQSCWGSLHILSKGSASWWVLWQSPRKLMSWDSPQSVLQVHSPYSSKGSASWQVMPQRLVLLCLQMQALLHPGQELVDLILPRAL